MVWAEVGEWQYLDEYFDTEPGIAAAMKYLREKECIGLLGGLDIWMDDKFGTSPTCKLRAETTEKLWKHILLPGINAVVRVLKWHVEKHEKDTGKAWIAFEIPFR